MQGHDDRSVANTRHRCEHTRHTLAMLARCGAMGLQLCSSQIGSLVAALPSACTLLRRYGNEAAKDGKQWHWMVSQGHKINPCNSMVSRTALVSGCMWLMG